MERCIYQVIDVTLSQDEERSRLTPTPYPSTTNNLPPHITLNLHKAEQLVQNRN
ncbi:MAG: hypothetical protein PUP93_29045 [Rhizonema sp. NSF051]|nr:hypothetical protein [Rhizonema sp. NSF051]